MRSRRHGNSIKNCAYSPTALQENEKLCHFHLDPRVVLLLRGANVEHQIPRNLYDNTQSRISLPVQDHPE